MHSSSGLQEVPTDPAPLVRPARRHRILLVEDDVDMRKLIAAMLRRDGYDVVQVGSGSGMLRRVAFGDARETFDLIVSDVQLPDLSALEALEGLRCRDIDVPVLLITAYGSDDVRADASTLGTLAVLDKPLDWDALRAAVRQAVSGK